ncbi:MAG TPA: hypothetical protein VEQ65_06975, partial [Opitutus sp.]|nr:hypothetical protein [Opitutus sp.]
GIVVPLVSSADDSQQASSAWFRLTLAASPSPATWDENASAYVTKLTFGLRRPPQIPEAIRLSQPVLVKLAYEGITADELPPLTIEAAGLQYEKTVELRFRPQTPAPRLLVRSTLSDVDVALEALGRLELRPQQRAMLGYGLESVEIVVENVRPHGEPMAVERKTPLVIESDARARVETADVNFEAGAARTVFRVRSAGAGPVTFMATAAGIRGQTTVQQEFPLAPLAGAVLGGALGGFSRRFVKGARRKQAARRIGEGIVVATVAFVAAVLGVGYLNLPAAVAATEAGAFLVGALAGFAGVTVLETVGKKTASA